MANFDLAIVPVLQHEGGFVYNSQTGEAANFGVTHWLLRSLGRLPSPAALATPSELRRVRQLAPGVASERMARDSEIAFINALTVDAAKTIYYQEFWDMLRLSEILSQPIANKILDLEVNIGPEEVVLLLQRALNERGAGLVVDGKLGPKTLAAVNATETNILLGQRQKNTVPGSGIRGEAEQFYIAITREHPEDAPDLPGWLARLDT